MLQLRIYFLLSENVHVGKVLLSLRPLVNVCTPSKKKLESPNERDGVRCLFLFIL